MSVENVAKRALEFIGGIDNCSVIGYRERLALIGYFNGVVSGSIEIGQNLIGEMLLNSRAPWAFVTDYRKHVFQKNEEELFIDIFSSGMCTEGQPLKGLAAEKGPGWVGRS